MMRNVGRQARLDLLSFQYYNTVTLWRVIAAVNDISDPLTEVWAGRILRIPYAPNVFSQIR